MKSSKSGTAKAEASSGRQTTTPDNAALMPNCKKTVFTCTLAVAPAYFSLPENSFTRIGSTLISLMWLHDVLDLIQQQQRTRSSSESAVFLYRQPFQSRSTMKWRKLCDQESLRRRPGPSIVRDGKKRRGE